MTWRRKPDGRPYADVFVAGRRTRVSLLQPGERAPYPDDAEAERRYRVLVNDRLPLLEAAAHPDQPKPGNPTIAQLAAWYLNTILPGRGYKPQSIAAARDKLRSLLQFATGRAIRDLRAVAADTAFADEYVAWLRRQNYAPATIQHRLQAAKTLLAVAMRRGLVAAPPVREWPRVRVPDRRIEVFSPEELRLVLDTLRATPHLRHYYPIIAFIAYTGCRPVDACRLQRSDLHDARALIVQAKTGKLVAIPLSPPAQEAVHHALTYAPARCPYVFTMNGHPFNRATLVSRARPILKAILGRTASLKMFRQTLVTQLLRAGADRAHIALITGHRSNAIEKYIHLDSSDAAAWANAFATTISQSTHTPPTPHVTPTT